MIKFLKEEMNVFLTRHMEEGDWLTDLGVVPSGGLVTIAITTPWWDPRRFKTAQATVIERDLSRPEDGTLLRLFKEPANPRRFALDYPCFLMPVVED
jgi:hypothetical protein